jgi:hypothetical protein
LLGEMLCEITTWLTENHLLRHVVRIRPAKYTVDLG